MYKCEDCGSIFDEPYEYHEYDVGYHADWCPYCHSDDIVEVKECKLCGNLSSPHAVRVVIKKDLSYMSKLAVRICIDLTVCSLI